MVQQTNTLIVGAGVAGLATAACLQRRNIDYIIIERSGQIASAWRNHYERLHLHTSKAFSNLPYHHFPHFVQRYPSRKELIAYLESYREKFQIEPVFNTHAEHVYREGQSWITKTGNGNFESENVVIATGAYGKAREAAWSGIETFPGTVVHSSRYHSGDAFKGQQVLVVGFGNSACEIALDLLEQGAIPSMSVRSAVNVVPRELLGIPILSISQILSKLPVRVADAINAPLMRLLFGDLQRLGLQPKPYGVFQQIAKEGTIPVLDLGTLRQIRKGTIRVFGAIDHIAGNVVHFAGGKNQRFDSIVAAIGFSKNDTPSIAADPLKTADLKKRVDQQKYFASDGLYYCGFYIGATGLIHEIAREAKIIAASILSKSTHTSAHTRP